METPLPPRPCRTGHAPHGWSSITARTSWVPPRDPGSSPLTCPTTHWLQPSEDPKQKWVHLKNKGNTLHTTSVRCPCSTFGLCAVCVYWAEHFIPINAEKCNPFCWLTILHPFQVIYIARNPRDVAVSYYHFHNMAKFLPEPGSFEEFLSNFLNGKGQQTQHSLLCLYVRWHWFPNFFVLLLFMMFLCL